MTVSQLEPVAGEAVASFRDMPLSAATQRALARMGIETPTPIQAGTLPALLAGHDVVGQARTGSGKTLAFGIPAIEFVDPRLRAVQVLVLTPTRELAVQVASVLKELGAEKGAEVVTIFGGTGVGPQRLALRKGVHIVVGTPGRVLDLINQGALWLARVRLLVLDEADEMLDYGFAPDVEKIIARTTPDRQTALFSATVPDWVRTTAAKHLHDPVTVAAADHGEVAPPAIEHVAFDVPDGDKVGVLKELLAQPAEGQTIVFGRTKRGVARLARRLVGEGYPVVALQGDMAQNARDRAMADFRAGTAPILLATNVAARGIDVTNVERVINIELPESPNLLTHRIGRTGRMGRQGQAITLLGPEDGPKWRQLQRGLTTRIPRLPWPGAEAAVAGGFETVEPTPEPTLPTRRRGSRTVPATNGRSGSTASGRTTAVANGRGEALPINGRGGPHVTPRAAAPASGNGRRPSPEAPSRPVPMGADRGRRNAGPIGAPRVKAAMAARAAGASWEDADAMREHATVPVSVPHAIVPCSRCGGPADVPFQPDPSRPVYCAGCYRRQRRSS